MVSEVLLFIGRLISPEPQDLRPVVAAEAAFVVNTARLENPDADKCCGLCVNGMITHGDGHKTPCPSPPDCECKLKGAVHHPPAKLHACPDGKCELKPKR